jgi:hypothetical protein
MDIKDKIKPLDLIVFRGSDFVSNSISLMEKIRLGKGDWTHVGLVVTPEIIPIKNSQPGKLYIWESTMSGRTLGDGVNNIETGAATFGVQIRDLEDVIDKYDNDIDTKIGWCQLINNPLNQKPDETNEAFIGRKLEICEKLSKFDNKIGNATYDYNLLNLLSTMCPTCTRCRRSVFGHAEKYFCSELVTNIYQIVDVMPKDIDPELVAPEELLGYTNDGIVSPVAAPVLLTRVWKK